MSETNTMKILACTDGSAQAENTIRLAGSLAARCHAELTLLGISERPEDEEPLLEALKRGQQLLREHQLRAELIVKAGNPVTEIARRTQETAYDLVMIGAVRKGDRGPYLMSARAYQIVEAAAPPVLIVIGAKTEINRILLCSGGARFSEKAVVFAAQLAKLLQASITLFHVLAAPPAIYRGMLRREQSAEELLKSGSELGVNLSAQKEIVEGLGVPCEVRLRHGMVVPEMSAEMHDGGYDMVVAGSYPAPGRFRNYILGNLTREIINHADLPVLVVRAASFEPRQRMRLWAGKAWRFLRRQNAPSQFQSSGESAQQG